MFDKLTGKVFSSAPTRLACEAGFYEAPALGAEVDQEGMERLLSELERPASQVLRRWDRDLPILKPGAPIVQRSDRDIIAAFAAVQALRTAELRTLLGEVLRDDKIDLQTLHVSMLCDDMIREAAAAIWDMIWAIGRNESGVPFYTSDHPVVLRSHDHHCMHFFQFPQPGTEVVFPLSPTMMLYAYERTHWAKLEKFDGCVSPVPFTRELVEPDNCGQVGHSRRFVYCDRDSFDFARSFCAQHPVLRNTKRDRFVTSS